MKKEEGTQSSLKSEELNNFAMRKFPRIENSESEEDVRRIGKEEAITQMILGGESGLGEEDGFYSLGHSGNCQDLSNIQCGGFDKMAPIGS